MTEIWQVAMDMEVKGRDHYLEMVEKSTIGEVKGIFQVLADEEQRHYDLFKALGEGNPAEATAGKDPGAVAKEAFAELAPVFEDTSTVEGAVEAYEKALSLEQGGIAYYTEILGKLDDERQKSAVQLILTEEKHHEKLVKGLIEFVRRPNEWLENAEFNQLDEY